MTLDVFDKAISRKGIPTHFRDAAVELNDTMELAWASAQSVFGKAAKPEHAIALLPMFMERADAIRRQLEVGELLGTAPAPTPAPTKPSRAARPGSSKAT